MTEAETTGAQPVKGDDPQPRPEAGRDAIPRGAPQGEAGGEAPAGAFAGAFPPLAAREQVPAGPASLDALELRLSVRVGEALISLADLRQMGSGTVVTLDRPDGALVDLIVNGQVIGTGQIISVAGQKACEIRTLFGDG